MITGYQVKGGINLSKLVGSLPPRVKNKLVAFILCEDSSMEDEIC